MSATRESSAGLTYRLYRDADRPALQKLWNEETKWGNLTRDLWDEWFVNTPYDPAIIGVVEDESGRIVGQAVGLPTLVQVDDRQVRALRLSSGILQERVRKRRLSGDDHPIIRCFQCLRESAAVSRVYELVYGLPVYAWTPAFKNLAGYQVQEYHCVERSLSRETGDSRGLTVKQASGFGLEYERLWEEARQSFPIECGVVRNRRWLDFRSSGRLVLEIRSAKSGRLEGFVAIRKDGLIADVLTRRKELLVGALEAVLHQFPRTSDRSLGQPQRLKAMETSVLKPALEALGFERSSYRFAFFCRQLGSAVSAKQIAPARWYVTPGD